MLQSQNSLNNTSKARGTLAMAKVCFHLDHVSRIPNMVSEHGFVLTDPI
jgi:hypothetical protein